MQRRSKGTSYMVAGKRVRSVEPPFIKPSGLLRLIHYHENSTGKTHPHDSITSHWVPATTHGDYGNYNSRWDLGGDTAKPLIYTIQKAQMWKSIFFLLSSLLPRSCHPYQLLVYSPRNSVCIFKQTQMDTVFHTLGITLSTLFCTAFQYEHHLAIATIPFTRSCLVPLKTANLAGRGGSSL